MPHRAPARQIDDRLREQGDAVLGEGGAHVVDAAGRSGVAAQLVLLRAALRDVLELDKQIGRPSSPVTGERVTSTHATVPSGRVTGVPAAPPGASRSASARLPTSSARGRPSIPHSASLASSQRPRTSSRPMPSAASSKARASSAWLRRTEATRRPTSTHVTTSVADTNSQMPTSPSACDGRLSTAAANAAPARPAWTSAARSGSRMKAYGAAHR
jgi:hypothetical protein